MANSRLVEGRQTSPAFTRRFSANRVSGDVFDVDLWVLNLAIVLRKPTDLPQQASLRCPAADAVDVAES